MSQEQLTPPSFDQSPSSDATRFETDDALYLRKSKLESIEQARANLALALAAEPVDQETTPEVVIDEAEKKQLAALQLVYWEGSQLEDFRGAYERDNFDLNQDEKPTKDMFGLAA